MNFKTDKSLAEVRELFNQGEIQSFFVDDRGKVHYSEKESLLKEKPKKPILNKDSEKSKTSGAKAQPDKENKE